MSSVPDDGRDALIWELSQRGESERSIARQVKVSKTYVHKMLTRLRSVPDGPAHELPVSPAETFDEGSPGDPLIVSLLSKADLAVLGLSADDLAGFRGNELHAYRLMGVVHTERARKARELLSGRFWAEWLLREVGALERVDGSDGQVSRDMRDARIVELRRSGWTLEAIAAEVGMKSRGAVLNALNRIARELDGSGESGRAPRRRRAPGYNRATREDGSEAW